MTAERFNQIIKEQFELCESVLCSKAKEYATEDRLHNFKMAAGMMGCEPREALAGMMAKHTISIYDMCRAEDMAPMMLWDEKITDSINYLLLLKALVMESPCDTPKVNKEVNEDPFVRGLKDQLLSIFPLGTAELLRGAPMYYNPRRLEDSDELLVCLETDFEVMMLNRPEIQKDLERLATRIAGFPIEVHLLRPESEGEYESEHMEE